MWKGISILDTCDRANKVIDSHSQNSKDVRIDFPESGGNATLFSELSVASTILIEPLLGRFVQSFAIIVAKHGKLQGGQAKPSNLLTLGMDQAVNVVEG